MRFDAAIVPMPLATALRSWLPVAGTIAAARKPTFNIKQQAARGFSRSIEQHNRGGRETHPISALHRSAVGVAPPAVMANSVFKDSWVVLAHDSKPVQCLSGPSPSLDLALPVPAC